MGSTSRRDRRRLLMLVAGGAALVCGRDAHAQELLAEWDSQHGGQKAWDQFANAMALLGDVDGDGWPEIVVGARNYDLSGAYPETGAVFVLSTKDGSILRKDVGAARTGHLGNALDAGVDLDQDGVPDYIAGAPEERGSRVMGGRVHAWSGATGAELYVLDGERFSDSFGHDVTFVDDLDGDGTEEIAVVAVWWDDASGGLGQCGRGYCYSGRSGTLLWTFDGTQQDQWIYSCCPLDDFNGDGIAEVGFGSIGTGAGLAGEGTFDVVDGASGQSLLQIAGENAKDSFGRCGRIGDVNRDGVRDVVIGAPGHSTAGLGAGRVYVVSGSTYSRIFTFDGTAASEFFGGVSPRFGDFDANSDGWPDVVVGSGNRVRTGCMLGVQLVYDGRTGRLLYEYRARPEIGLDDLFGLSGTPIGDVTGDGVSDVVIGANGGFSSIGGLEGRAYLFACRQLFLQADQVEYQPNDPITLELRGGSPGALGLIAVVAIDGAPLFAPVAFAPLDANGELAYSDVADPSLSGLTIELQGFCQKPTLRGALGTVVETIRFQ